MELTKSEQIRNGLQKSFRSGKSTKASTICYGYQVSSFGKLLINPAEANTVAFIFNRFAKGDSLGKISDKLAHMGINSPSGNATWSRETISKLLSNKKYVGDVVLGKSQVIDGVQVKSHNISKQILMREHHPAIISRELFHIVQQAKCKRSRNQTAVR